MQHNITVMSRGAAIEMSNTELDHDTVIVSITGFGGEFPEFADNPHIVGVCYVQFDDEEQGKSLRETLAEEPELCKVLQEAKVITEKQCEQIMPKNTIEEDNNTFKEKIATTPEYNLWCLQNPFIGKDKSTGKWGCFGIDCC